MGRVLFGSEFGANLGHIYPMKRIADRLHANGHEIVFAVRNLIQTKRAFKGTDYKLVQAPFWLNLPGKDINRMPTPSYADVMTRQGFGFKENLSGFFGAWADLTELVKPDVVIADHSPGLSAAIRRRYPMINFGNGFTLPPSHLEEYPPVIATGKPLAPQSKLLDIFNEAYRVLVPCRWNFCHRYLTLKGSMSVRFRNWILMQVIERNSRSGLSKTALNLHLCQLKTMCSCIWLMKLGRTTSS